MRISDCIAESHPALAGHFPGDPIVPGALLLARVARAAAKLADAPLAAVPVVRFHAPLRPGERFEVQLDRAAGARIEFCVRRGDTKIASGSLRFGGRDAA